MNENVTSPVGISAPCEPSGRTASTRFLYFVTAHKSPAQTARLVGALLAASESGQVLLHYDPASPTLNLGDLASNERVHQLPNPLEIRWGDFSLVEALLRGLRWAIANLDFDWLIWLSGQDYPLGTLQTFESELAHGSHDGYFRHFRALGHPGWPLSEGLKRYYFRYFDLPRNSYFYRLPLSVKVALGALRKRFVDSQQLVMIWPRQRNNPAKLGLRRLSTPFSPSRPCIGGWVWLNIRRTCAEYIVDYAQKHPKFVRHYQSSYCPDESFAHSILVNAGSFDLANLAFRHIYWGDKRFPSSPRTITVGESLDSALCAGSPFARKFDEGLDAVALDILDARIKNGVPAPCRLDI